MKYVIELPEDEYEGIVDSTYPNDTLVGALIYALKNGKPLDAVLDEMMAEIEQNAYPIVHGVNSHEKGMTLYGVLQIIDKHRKGGANENTP